MHSPFSNTFPCACPELYYVYHQAHIYTSPKTKPNCVTVEKAYHLQLLESQAHYH